MSRTIRVGVMTPDGLLLRMSNGLARPMQGVMPRNESLCSVGSLITQEVHGSRVEDVAVRQGCENRQVHDVEEGTEVSEHSCRGAGSQTRLRRHEEEVGASDWRCTAARARDDP